MTVPEADFSGRWRAVAPKYWPQSADTHYGRSVDYRTDRTVHTLPLQTPSMDHSQNRIKLINNDCTYRFSNRQSVLTKFRTVRCANVTDLGAGSSTGNLITHVNFLCCDNVWKTGKPPGSLENLCSFPSTSFFSPFSRGSWTSSRLHKLLNGIFVYKRAYTTYKSLIHSRLLSHNWEIRTCLLFAISIFKNNIKKTESWKSF